MKQTIRLQMPPCFVLVRFLLPVWIVAMGDNAWAQQPVEPLLQKYCLGCHNRQDAEVGLSLQTFDAIKKGSANGPVLDRANPKDGLLYQVLQTDVDNTMPPQDELQPTTAERQVLKQWVLSGAAIQAMAAGIPDVPQLSPFSKRKSESFASVAISPTELAIGGSRQISIHDVATGRQLRKFDIPQGNVTGLTWAASSKQLLAAVGLPGIDGTALLLSANDGKIQRSFKGHTDALYCAAINQNENRIATAGYDRRIVIHDVRTGNVLRTLKGHHGSIFQLSFDGSGTILCSASTDGTVKVWNVMTGERLDTLSQAQGEQYCVQISSTLNRIFAAGADNRIRAWNLVAKDQPTINPLLSSLFAHEQTIHKMRLSPDETKLATAAEDGTVRIWTTNPLQQLQTLPRQESMVTSLAFSTNQNLTVTTLNGPPQAFKLRHPATEKTSTNQASQSANANPSAKMPQPMVSPHLNKDASTVAVPIAITESNSPNHSAATAEQVALPATVSGHIYEATGGPDRDCYMFEAIAGQALVLEVNAARKKSPLDSKIEILTESGQPLLRTRLQAVRDSWFTFRGKDGHQSGDFRLFNWREMELNQYLYADGEVTKLHHYPRGPDSGFNVYPGFGKRHTYFGTTGTSHALLAPAFIVQPHPPESEIVSNGLPTFPVYYENDDDGLREFGADSRLFFEVRNSGRYVVRISDAREFSGEDFHYDLTLRETRPSFSVSHNGSKFSVSKDSGKEIEFKAKRIDGYDGPITIYAEEIPAGYICSTPITIQREQYRAYATIFATNDAVEITDEQRRAIRFFAKAGQDNLALDDRATDDRATDNDATDDDATGDPANRERPHLHAHQQPIEISGFTEFKLLKDPKLKVAIHPSKPEPPSDHTAHAAKPIVLSIQPGQTINAFLTLSRLSHNGIVSFGKEDAGRNLPYGVFVDNIGLNGLLLLEGQSQREFYITASPVAEPGTYTFHLKSNVNGVTSYPATLVVEPRESQLPNGN
ncbi:MAG: c-type cytochrome domain-containing protein [Fuerstiella sp.]